MELTDYIDSDEGRMEAEPAEAAYECFNCGKTCDQLHYVPEFDYMGCEECLDEAMALLEAEAAGKELYPAERQILAAARRKSMGRAVAVKKTPRPSGRKPPGLP
jgi:hypothetical protein